MFKSILHSGDDISLAFTASILTIWYVCVKGSNVSERGNCPRFCTTLLPTIACKHLVWYPYNYVNTKEQKVSTKGFYVSKGQEMDVVCHRDTAISTAMTFAVGCTSSFGPFCLVTRVVTRRFFRNTALARPVSVKYICSAC